MDQNERKIVVAELIKDDSGSIIISAEMINAIFEFFDINVYGVQNSLYRAAIAKNMDFKFAIRPNTHDVLVEWRKRAK